MTSPLDSPPTSKPHKKHGCCSIIMIIIIGLAGFAVYANITEPPEKKVRREAEREQSRAESKKKVEEKKVEDEKKLQYFKEVSAKMRNFLGVHDAIKKEDAERHTIWIDPSFWSSQNVDLKKAIVNATGVYYLEEDQKLVQSYCTIRSYSDDSVLGELSPIWGVSINK